jgi:MinD superfamily P-loop ATPase
MIKKDLVQKNFSRGSDTYEEFAKVQKYMANELISFRPLEENINILTKIPDDRKIAECYSKGELVLRAMPEFKKYFEPLLNIVREAL